MRSNTASTVLCRVPKVKGRLVMHAEHHREQAKHWTAKSRWALYFG